MGDEILEALVLLGDSQPLWHYDYAKLIARHLSNVPTYFTHRITNAVAEGLNSKITVQKRACGYRNPNHFKIAVYFHCASQILSSFRYPHKSRMNQKRKITSTKNSQCVTNKATTLLPVRKVRSVATSLRPQVGNVTTNCATVDDHLTQDAPAK